MYSPRYFSLLELSAYPERASPDYLIYVQQILARKRHKYRRKRR